MFTLEKANYKTIDGLLSIYQTKTKFVISHEYNFSGNNHKHYYNYILDFQEDFKNYFQGNTATIKNKNKTYLKTILDDFYETYNRKDGSYAYYNQIIAYNPNLYATKMTFDYKDLIIHKRVKFNNKNTYFWEIKANSKLFNKIQAKDKSCKKIYLGEYFKNIENQEDLLTQYFNGSQEKLFYKRPHHKYTKEIIQARKLVKEDLYD